MQNNKIHRNTAPPIEETAKRHVKSLLSTILSFFLRVIGTPREGLSRLFAHASLAAHLKVDLPASAVVLGKVMAGGTGNVRIGENVLLYPGVYFETQGEAWIEIGHRVVISRGVHIVAMAGVRIGSGSMIGEYTSIRDANHARLPDHTLRESGHTARPIILGEDVWVGRGAAVLGGVTMGDRATAGANAVVTRDVAAGETVVGVPATPIESKSSASA